MITAKELVKRLTEFNGGTFDEKRWEIDHEVVESRGVWRWGISPYLLKNLFINLKNKFNGF